VSELTDEYEFDRRRVRALGELAVQIAGCADADDVGPAAVTALTTAGLPFARAYRRDGPLLRLSAALPDVGLGPTPHALAEVISTGAPATLPANLFTTAAEPDTHAIALPLGGGTNVLGVLVAGLGSDPRAREFVQLVADAATAALTNARDRQLDRRRIDELEKLDAAKSDLFANASHELRTPLTLVSAPAEEALSDTDEPLPPVQRERIRLVRRNAARLRRMLNNILDVTRITNGGLQADRVATELGQLTREIAASFAPAIERGGLTFEVESPRLSRMTFVDREMWERIVLNLLSNALKFTLSGRITLRLHGNNEQVLLSVQDTGIGIPTDQIPLLFNRFHRVKGNIGRTGEGAGIGLALVNELVALHDGTVSVHSSPGEGSTFEVRIPYGTGAMSAPGRQPGWVREVHLAEAFGWLADSPEPPTAVDDGPPVLIVEDNAELRGYLVRLLSPQWTVKAAGDGRAALALARATKPALVLTDVALPGMTGLSLLNALRGDPGTADVPIILLSAQAGAEATADALHAGADDYLVKPFSSVELLARVRSTIELARLRAQHSAREMIQARFAEQLAEATEVREVLAVAADHLGAPWNAANMTVVSWDTAGRPKIIRGPAAWESIPSDAREAIEDLRHQPGLSVTSRPADLTTGAGAGAGATIDVLGEATVVWLDLPPEPTLTSSDRNLLRSLCGQLGLALSRARSFEQQRTVAVTLQRSILGPETTPGGGFAVRYEPAHSPLEVGGDWYDIVDLPYGGTGLVVGDCVGRGLDAATVMGQLRSACRALLLQHNSPAATLSALDGFAGTLDGGACTTVLCAWLSPDTGVLTYSSAGHPPPVVVDPEGNRTLLDQATSVPLAVRTEGQRPEHTMTLGPGSTLLIYTDGLVERPGAPIDTGIDAAADILVAGRRMPEEALADRVLGAIGPRTGADDVAVLLYRQAAPGAARFVRSFPADPSELRPARVALQAWLTAWSVEQDVIERATLAAGEAWTNALEHGYQLNEKRIVHTSAMIHAGELELMVADLGVWKKPGPAGNRGRGIRLMEGVCDQVSIDTDQQGTTVRLVIKL
jgi:signal transduction histidine kinase/CheY-like chemotaxis protein/anti-sigma regulatory factor (Ser/Thr protein kinase)